MFVFGFEELSLDVNDIGIILFIIFIQNNRIVFQPFACVGFGFIFIIRYFAAILSNSINIVLPWFIIRKHRFHLHLQIKRFRIKLRLFIEVVLIRATVVLKPRTIIFKYTYLIIYICNLFFAYTVFPLLYYWLCIFRAFTTLASLLTFIFRLCEFLSDWIGNIIESQFG